MAYPQKQTVQLFNCSDTLKCNTNVLSKILIINEIRHYNQQGS